MSIALVEQEIRRLLATRDADVVCISGHWGVGKTYAWNKYLAHVTNLVVPGHPSSTLRNASVTTLRL